MDTYQKIIDWLNVQARKKGGVVPLGESLKATRSTFHRVLNGGSPPSADKLLAWLEQLGAQVVLPDDAMEDFDLVGKVCAKAGAGSSLLTSDKVQAFYAFRKDFLRQQGVHADKSIMMDVLGPSMEPLIKDGDTILVDQMDTDLRDGKIYLVGYEDDLLVKQLQKMPGGWRLHSINTDYADTPIIGEEVERMRVYGRVRWFGRVL